MRNIVILVAVLTASIIGFFVYTQFIAKSQSVPTVPEEITEKLQIPFYFPTWLPGTFALDKDSVQVQEDKVMTYSATDADRNRLFFSQQVKPEDFDFDRFYKTEMIYAQKLENTPYETYYGKALYNNVTMLSIVTNTTWILMTTQAPIDKVMAQKIAQEMKIRD